MLTLLEEIRLLKKEDSDYDPVQAKIQPHEENIKDQIYNGKAKIAEVLSQSKEFILKLIDEQ